MSTSTTEKPNKQATSTAIIVRVDLSKSLTPSELDSFKTQAERAGRTVREHFLAITLGERSDQPAA
jgi:hypothetical protein